MHRQALLVELGALDRAGGLLDAEADEARGGDVLPAHHARLAVDIFVVVEVGGAAAPVAGEGELDPGAQQLRQARGVGGGFVEDVGGRVGVGADDAQDAAPGDELAAEAAQMAGGEVRVAALAHQRCAPAEAGA